MLHLSTWIGIAALFLALSPTWRRSLGQTLQLLLLARVPVLVLSTLVLGPIVVGSDTQGMLANLLVLERFGHGVAVTCLAVAVGWVATLCIETTVVHAPARMGSLRNAEERSPAGAAGAAPQSVGGLLRRLTKALGAAFPLLAAIQPTGTLAGFRWPLAAILGIALAAALEGLVAVVWKQLQRRPALLLGRVAARLTGDEADSWLAGYWAQPSADQPGPRLHGEHLHQGAYLIVLFLFYVCGAWLLHPLTGDPARLPTIGYVLGLLALGCVLLSGLSFALDRYRVPLLVALLLLGLVTNNTFDSGHYYPLADSAPTPPTAREALERRLERLAAIDPAAGRTVLVVAASGGGIGAAAWTTRVLAGLEQELGALLGVPAAEQFRAAIVFASGISGGSVGLLHSFGAAAEGAIPGAEVEAALDPRYGAGARAVALAQRDALPSVGYGLAYPDLRRVLVPILADGAVDRGWAMDRFWWRGLGPATPVSTFDAWVAGSRSGALPGLSFGATALETGSRVLLANVDIGGLDSSTLDHDQLGAVDPIVAARLSATFPYVTPAARRRAARGEAAVHLIDGGYFDNSGVATALDWIDDCFGSPREPGTRASQVERVLLLMIDPFPRGEPTLEPTGGWVAATLGPLLGVLAVRTGSQRAHMTQSIRQQRALLAARGGPELVPLTVRAGVDLPLSWKLTPGQQGLLDGAWDDRRIELREVLRQSARFGSDSTRDSGGGRPPTIPGLDQPFTPLALDVGFVEWLKDWSEAQSEWR